MKSTLLAVSITLLTLHARAQITLAHAYPDSMNTLMQCVKVEGEGYKYYGFDAATRSIKVYNADHSLWKTINVAIPTNALLGNCAGCKDVSFLSKRLFDLDTNLEVLVRYTVPSSTPGGNVTYHQVWSETGLVFTFPVASGHNIIFTDLVKQDSSFKMLIQYQGGGHLYTHVYSLAGTIPTGARSITLEDENSLTVYPNPTSSLVAVRFRQPTTAAVVRMINAAGSLILQQPVEPGSRELQIDVSQYPAGQYFFEAVEANGRTATARFEKQ